MFASRVFFVLYDIYTTGSGAMRDARQQQQQQHTHTRQRAAVCFTGVAVVGVVVVARAFLLNEDYRKNKIIFS